MSTETEPRRYSREEVTGVPNEFALTALENWLLGKTPTKEAASSAMTLTGLVNGRFKLKDLAAQRREQKWLAVGLVLGVILEMDIAKKIPLINLDEPNPDGKVVNLPTLYGIYDIETQEIDTNEDTLNTLEFTKKKAMNLLEACRKSVEM